MDKAGDGECRVSTGLHVGGLGACSVVTTACSGAFREQHVAPVSRPVVKLNRWCTRLPDAAVHLTMGANTPPPVSTLSRLEVSAEDPTAALPEDRGPEHGPMCPHDFQQPRKTAPDNATMHMTTDLA